MVAFVLSPFSYVSPAQAQVAGVASTLGACIGFGAAIGAVKSAVLSPFKVPVQDSDVAQNTSTQIQKECSLDAVAYAVAKLILRRITDDVVAYINSGFEGNPAFLDNPGDFFRNIGDQVAGELIYGSDLNFLCSPFQDILRGAIKIRYAKFAGDGFKDTINCTLSGVLDNIDDFANGDFSLGTLTDITQIALEPQNNAFGAYIEVSAELDDRLSKALDIEEGQLNRNKGFLSIKDKDGNVVTPGVVIEGQLSKVLGTGVTQLELADEFNEIADALVGQLANKVFSKGGLLSQ